MIAFTNMSYTMMTTLLVTVPTLEDVCIECLGDIARYRWAISHSDDRERRQWCGIARYWYQKKSMGSPHTGRLYHHLALLATSALEQLALLVKSLTRISAHQQSQSSVISIFKAMLDRANSIPQQAQSFDDLSTCPPSSSCNSSFCFPQERSFGPARPRSTPHLATCTCYS